MKKILIPLVALILLCGCEVQESINDEKNKYDHNQDKNISFYTDYKTCVEYLVLSEKRGYGGMGGLSVRYNVDGTIKVNKECLKEKTKNEENQKRN